MSDKWFYLDEQSQRGPFTVEELAELAAMGKLEPHTLVRKEGNGGCWESASQLSELAALRFSDAPAGKKAADSRHADMFRDDGATGIRRAVVAARVGDAIFLFAVVLILLALWFWLTTGMRFGWVLAMASTVVFGVGLCRSYLRRHYADPRQDPVGQELGVVYPLFFGTAAGLGFALWAIVWFIANQ